MLESHEAGLCGNSCSLPLDCSTAGSREHAMNSASSETAIPQTFGRTGCSRRQPARMLRFAQATAATAPCICTLWDTGPQTAMLAAQKLISSCTHRPYHSPPSVERRFLSPDRLAHPGCLPLLPCAAYQAAASSRLVLGRGKGSRHHIQCCPQGCGSSCNGGGGGGSTISAYAFIASQPNLSTAKSVIDETGLRPALEGPFADTLFVPTNEVSRS
jgi:hypothetical protein